MKLSYRLPKKLPDSDVCLKSVYADEKQLEATDANLSDFGKTDSHSDSLCCCKFSHNKLRIQYLRRYNIKFQTYKNEKISLTFFAVRKLRKDTVISNVS